VAAEEKTAPAAGESPPLALLERVLAAQEKATTQLMEQLKVKDDQIAALNERLRESNVLMASLQQQLPEPNKKLGTVDAKPAAAGKPKKEGSPAPTKTKRRSWLKSIFS